MIQTNTLMRLFIIHPLYACITLLSCLSLALASTVLAADTAVLQGRVLDMNGNPMQGAEVYVYDLPKVKRPADFISNRTGGDGRFRVVLPPGKYWTVAMHRKSGLRFGPLAIGDKHSGEPRTLLFEKNAERDIDFIVLGLSEAAQQHNKRNTETIEINGRIIDGSSRPVQSAYIIADPKQNPEMPAYISAWTDSQGYYTLFLPRGRYYVGAATDFPPAGGFLLPRQMEFTDDLSGFDVLLKKKPPIDNTDQEED